MENKNVECKANVWSFGKEHPYLAAGLIWAGIYTVRYVVYVIGKVAISKNVIKASTNDTINADYTEVHETETSNN